MNRSFLLPVVLVACLPALAQTPLTVEEYAARKSDGTLPPDAFVVMKPQAKPIHPSATKGGGGSCDCWIEPDGGYTLAMGPNDDGSSDPIVLPFDFSLFGDVHDTVHINNNGNVSFDMPYGTFSADSFPSPNYVMVSPFWGDVDTRDTLGGAHGEVWYKVTATALYVNWVNVGYYPLRSDKLNSFQVIISDGSDPVIPDGNNVSFCYKDMAWTTGQASCYPDTSCTNAQGGFSCINSGGLGYGFCGIPATVGANRGNDIDHAQIGRFNMPDTNYYGPYGAVSEVDWLDSMHFHFNTISALGVPPIFASTFGCDTIIVMVGSTLTYHMLVIAGGPGEAASTLSACTTLASYAELSSTTGPISVTTSTVSPVPGDLGFHTVHYAATNDDAVPLTAAFDLVIEVVPKTVGLPGPPSIQGFTLTPNPVSGELTVVLPHAMDQGTIQVLASDGRILLQKPVPAGTERLRLDLAGVHPGAYLVRVLGPWGTWSKALMKSDFR